MIKGILSFCFFMLMLSANENPHQVKLVDNLDRTSDGYCLDVLGSGNYIRSDMPLIGHNCKPGLYADEAFVFQNDGKIYFPVNNLCVTIAGVNKYVLDYSPLVLQECGKNTAFVSAKYMQEFEYTKEKKIKHKNSNMCLVMGNKSSRTFSVEHTWRTLYMKECSSVDNTRARWHFHFPKEKS